MRYIHARDITSERRKYINILFLVTSIVTTVLILFSLVGLISNVSKYVTAKKSLETAQADSATTEQELKKKVTAITGDEEYANYVISSSNTLSTFPSFLISPLYNHTALSQNLFTCSIL